MSEQQAQPIFSIEKLYVKDLSLEVPNAPKIFLEASQPEVEMQIQTQSQPINDGYFECTLTITVTAKNAERTYFLVEVAQAGLFLIRNVPDEDLEPILGMACPNILFPYVREAVSDLVTRAGFPPVVLAPLNFEQMYMQRQAQQMATQDAPATVQ
ncbi:protein-export chaperone SecB [Chitinimonas sp.]|uniref:protein-export chaperone SecB n=1 Tax=Chitinimonas sp. TaxID=1934313 RepID=UPI0035B3B8C8